MVVLASPSTPASFVRDSDSFGANMASFFHCNSCYLRPGMGVQRRFFITNCSHIYCETCVTAATKDKCKVCKSQCSTLCLSGKIPKEVESMFLEPTETLQKFLKEFFQRVEFQKSHHRRLIRHLTEQVKILEKKVVEMNKVYQHAQQMERALIETKSENEYLKLLLSKKDGHPRGGSKSGTSPSIFQASPSQTGSAFGKNHNFTSLQSRPGGGSNIPPQTGRPQTGRILLRTPPSGGRLGTIGGQGCTPTESMQGTPLTIPRPINLPH